MRKIKALLDKGWSVDLRTSKQEDGIWYSAGASHNTWGDVDVWDANLNTAIDRMYTEAKELELE